MPPGRITPFDGTRARLMRVLTGFGLPSGGCLRVLAEDIAPFTILPDIQIDGTVTTDKSSYKPNENVVIDMVLKNNGRNHILPELDVRLRIMGIQAQEVFNEEKGIGNLLPGTSASLSSTWDTGLYPPGKLQGSG